MKHTRHLSPKRLYRAPDALRPGEVAFQVVLEQTDLYIVARQDLSAQALDTVRQLRGILKAYMALNPDFAASLTPLSPAPNAHEIIIDMCQAGQICKVGPMAAVAGAIAQRVAQALLPLSPDILVENGGDLYLHSSRDRTVGLISDPQAGADLGLKFTASQFPLSVCASSATIGHSLSLGQGDLTVAVAPNACLADAAATALGNMLRHDGDINRALAYAKQLSPHGLTAALALLHGQLGAWGELELVAL